MKSALIGGAVLCLFFMFTTDISATACHGRSCDNVPGKECEKGNHTYNPHCSPLPSISPSGTPYATSLPTMSPVPSTTPEATISASPTAIPDVTPAPTPESPRTDLSDGRSDGLGCSVKDCSGNKVAQVASAQTNVPKVLPATGGNELLGNIIIGLIGIWLGFKIKSFTDGNQI